MQSGQWKRHGFSDFLTKTGVSAALADAVLEMCRAEQRPSDPIEYVLRIYGKYYNMSVLTGYLIKINRHVTV